MKNAFYSLMNAFGSNKNTFCIWRNAFFAVPRDDRMLSSRFKIVLHLNRKRSEPFFIWIENVLNRSFWNGQNRIPSKWDYFLWRSLKKHLRMDSLNWWTYSRHILQRSLNCWTLPPGFSVNFDSKLTVSEHDTLKLIPKMAEPSMGCTSGSFGLKKKKKKKRNFENGLSYEQSEPTVG
jgi:hypothetical protein